MEEAQPGSGPPQCRQQQQHLGWRWMVGECELFIAASALISFM